MDDAMNVLSQIFISNFDVAFIAIAIWAATIAGYCFWYRPAIASVAAGLNQITATLFGQSWPEARKRAQMV